MLRISYIHSDGKRHTIYRLDKRDYKVVLEEAGILLKDCIRVSVVNENTGKTVEDLYKNPERLEEYLSGIMKE